MAANLADLIQQVRQLSNKQKMVLITEIEGETMENLNIQENSEDFWDSQPLQENYYYSPIKVVTPKTKLRSRAWPEEESLDDFLEFTKAQRHLALAQKQT